MGAIMRGHKRYLLEYRSDKRCPGTWNAEINDYDHYLHDGGRGNTLRTMRGYINRIRKGLAEYKPRDFRVYDVDTDDDVVPCVYQED